MKSPDLCPPLTSFSNPFPGTTSMASEIFEQRTRYQTFLRISHSATSLTPFAKRFLPSPSIGACIVLRQLYLPSPNPAIDCSFPRCRHEVSRTHGSVPKLAEGSPLIRGKSLSLERSHHLGLSRYQRSERRRRRVRAPDA